MRWNLKEDPQVGDYRTVRRFLILPKCLDNQIRWLEWANITQCYWYSNVRGGTITTWQSEHWSNK